MLNSFFLSQFFAIIASIAYLMLFVFVVQNAVIRLTPYKGPLAKIVSATVFLAFTGVLYTWMGRNGFGSNANVLPSHAFVLAYHWLEFMKTKRQLSN